MIEKVIEKLTEISKQVAWDDDEDFLPDDYAGGNIDDAFDGGKMSGEIYLARALLKMLTEVK